MGVQGLKKLVDQSKVLEDFTLNNSHVVIDAPNLYYSLYFNSEPKLDQRHGGDYSGFRDEVCGFLQVLRNCNITPHMVLDGTSNPEKLETLKTRLQNKLETAKKVATNMPHSNILPPLAKDVFKQILVKEQVEFEESFAEADLRVVSWANHLLCPVLSNDSDFYIYDVKAGVLPLDQLQWKNNRSGHIQAKVYRRPRFCSLFRIDPALVPVFAAIAGNDYSKLEDGGKFTQRSSLPRLYAILNFLEKVNLKDQQEPQAKQRKALREAFTFVGKKATEEKCFLESIRAYEEHAETSETRGEDLPEWMSVRIKAGELTSFVTDVVRHRRMMLTPLVEDFSQPSSYAPALRLRQFFYGLLGQETCTEFDRLDQDSVSAREVSALLPSESQQLDQAPEAWRLQVLLEALDFQRLVSVNVPDNMKLQLLATGFWWRHQQDKPVRYLHALLLGFVYGECLGPGAAFEEKMKALKAYGSRIQWQPDVAHAFSQWQCCFRQSLHLNQLLRFPLAEPECSRLYCGPVVHQLAGPGPQNDPATVKLLMNEAQGRLFDCLETACQSLKEQGVGKAKRKMEAECGARKKSLF